MVKPFKVAVYVIYIYIYIVARFARVKNVKIEFAFSLCEHYPAPSVSFLPPPFISLPFCSHSPLPSLYILPLLPSFFFPLGFHYLIKFSVSDLTVLWKPVVPRLTLPFSGREKRPFLPPFLLTSQEISFLFPTERCEIRSLLSVNRLPVLKLLDSFIQRIFACTKSKRRRSVQRKQLELTQAKYDLERNDVVKYTLDLPLFRVLRV